MTEEDFNNIKRFKERSRLFLKDLLETKGPLALCFQPTVDTLCAAGFFLKLAQHKNFGAHTIYFSSFTELKKILSSSKYSTFLFLGDFSTDEFLSYIETITEKQFFLLNAITPDSIKGKNLTNVSYISIESDLDPITFPIAVAGISYFVCETAFDDNHDYIHLALLAALSLTNKRDKKQTFEGLNNYILKQAIEKKRIKEEKGIKIKGRDSQPIHLALKYSISPYFPGLTGNENACTTFLSSRANIKMKNNEDKWRTISDLSSEEVKNLNEKLIGILMSKGRTAAEEAKKLIGSIYIILNENKGRVTRDLEDFLQLIEATILNSHYGLALSLILGDRKNQYEKAKALLENYHGQGTTIIDYITQNPKIIEDYKEYTVIDATKFSNNSTAPYIFHALVQSDAISVGKTFILLLEADKLNIYIYENIESRVQKNPMIRSYIEEIKRSKTILDYSFEQYFTHFTLESKSKSEFLLFLKEKYLKKGEISAETNETRETNETNETRETNETNETNETRETDETAETNETRETDEKDIEIDSSVDKGKKQRKRSQKSNTLSSFISEKK